VKLEKIDEQTAHCLCESYVKAEPNCALLLRMGEHMHEQIEDPYD
jgi:hypothetical protein